LTPILPLAATKNHQDRSINGPGRQARSVRGIKGVLKCDPQAGLEIRTKIACDKLRLGMAGVAFC